MYLIVRNVVTIQAHHRRGELETRRFATHTLRPISSPVHRLMAPPNLSLGVISTLFAYGSPSLEDDGCRLDHRTYQLQPRSTANQSLQVLGIVEQEGRSPLLTLSDGIFFVKARIAATLWKHLQKSADTQLSPLCIVEIANRDWREDHS